MSLKKILIIDDEDDIREVGSFALEAVGGFDVATASSGAEGIACATDRQPDAILLDVMMPGLDGPSTLTALRERQETAAIPVVFLTAKVQAADRRRLLQLGARGIISKPFDPMLLGREVAAILGWSPIQENS